MLKKTFFCLLFLCLVLTGAFFSPFCLSQAKAATETFPLKEKQVKNILQITRQEPLSIAQANYFFASIDSDPYLNSRSTGAIVLVKQAILSDSLNFWFLKTPLGFSKNFLKIIAKLLPVVSGNFGGLISLVEKYTVDQANQYILEKLGENQIKMASGELSYVVPKTILGRTSLFKTNYIILYNPLTMDLIVEFYSHNPIEPPLGTDPNGLAIKQDNPNINCWPWDRWYEGEKQRDNDGKIEPFIVRVEGKVNQDKDNFNWQNKNQVKVEVVFGQKVPTIDQSDFIERTEEEITTSFLKDKILNKIDPRLGDILDKALEVKEKVENTLNIASTVFQAIKTIFNLGSSSPSQALISSHLSTEAPENTSLKSQPAQLEPTSPAKEAGTTSQVVPKSTNVVVIDNQEYEVFPVIDPKQAENKPIEIKNEPQNNKETEKTTLPLKEKESQEKQNITFCQITEQVKSQAAKQNKVIFNEIAWMGSTNSVNDEWLELKNIQNNLVNLDGWQIINQKEKIKIALTGNLGAGSFLLLERTDDNSAPKEKADFIYTGAIANTDEGLFLFSPNCVLEDKILANPYFPAGDNYLKKTMERKTDLTWQTSKDIGGTPKKANSSGTLTATGGSNSGASQPAEQPTNQSADQPDNQPTNQPDNQPTNQPDNQPTNQPATPSCSMVIITEIQVRSPEKSNADFIELYNPNDSECSLDGFKLRKQSSTGNEYSVKALTDVFLASKAYFLWANSTWQAPNGLVVDVVSTQTLANNNSALLVNANNEVISQVSWQEVPSGATFSRKYDSENQIYLTTGVMANDFELGSPTPKAQNQALNLSLLNNQPASQPKNQIISLTTGQSAQENVLDLFFLATSSLRYVLKMSQTPIKDEPEDENEIAFEEAGGLALNFNQQENNRVIKISLRDLIPDNLYYFALKFIKPDGTTSSISNLAKGKIKNQINQSALLNPIMASSTQYEATEFASSSGQKLANVKDLAALLNYSASGVFLKQGLEDLEKTIYWTADKQMVYRSGYPGDASRYYGCTVNLENGEFNRVYYDNTDSPKYPFLLLLDDGLPGFDPEQEIPLINNQDGTATDLKQGLMWAQAQFALIWENQRQTWDNALAFALNRVLCQDNTFLGNQNQTNDCSQNGGVKYDDWRLPNFHEFLNITKLGESLALPWLSGYSFYYWTSTEAPDNKAWAIGDGYQAGLITAENKTRLFNVQIVRDIVD